MTSVLSSMTEFVDQAKDSIPAVSLVKLLTSSLSVLHTVVLNLTVQRLQVQEHTKGKEENCSSFLMLLISKNFEFVHYIYVELHLNKCKHMKYHFLFWTLHSSPLISKYTALIEIFI